MGTWAEGNFDNDSALDLVTDVVNGVAQEMSPPSGIEDVDAVMGAVAVYKALVEHCHAPAPERQEIESLKAAVLSVYDQEIDELYPDPDHKVARRRVIAQTFEQFLDLLSK